MTDEIENGAKLREQWDSESRDLVGDAISRLNQIIACCGNKEANDRDRKDQLIAFAHGSGVEYVEGMSFDELAAKVSGPAHYAMGVRVMNEMAIKQNPIYLAIVYFQTYGPNVSAVAEKCAFTEYDLHKSNNQSAAPALTARVVNQTHPEQNTRH